MFDAKIHAHAQAKQVCEICNQLGQETNFLCVPTVSLGSQNSGCSTNTQIKLSKSGCTKDPTQSMICMWTKFDHFGGHREHAQGVKIAIQSHKRRKIVCTLQSQSFWHHWLHQSCLLCHFQSSLCCHCHMHQPPTCFSKVWEKWHFVFEPSECHDCIWRSCCQSGGRRKKTDVLLHQSWHQFPFWTWTTETSTLPPWKKTCALCDQQLVKDCSLTCALQNEHSWRCWWAATNPLAASSKQVVAVHFATQTRFERFKIRWSMNLLEPSDSWGSKQDVVGSNILLCCYLVAASSTSGLRHRHAWKLTLTWLLTLWIVAWRRRSLYDPLTGSTLGSLWPKLHFSFTDVAMHTDSP